MKNKGALLLMVMGLFLVLLYFAIFGFSHYKSARIGQYAAIGAVCFFILDELFKQN